MIEAILFFGLGMRGIVGDVVCFKGRGRHDGLRRLYLDRTSVRGDVTHFGMTKNLVYLSLDRCGDIGGSVAELTAHCRDLEVLHLTDCYHVEGTLDMFLGCPKLRVLRLGSTDIQGDVVAVSKMGKLTQVSLEKTAVFGDVSAFNGKPPRKMFSMGGGEKDQLFCAAPNAIEEEKTVHEFVSRFVTDPTHLHTRPATSRPLANLPASLPRTSQAPSRPPTLPPTLPPAHPPAHSPQVPPVEHPKIKELVLSNTIVQGDVSSLAECDYMSKLIIASTNIRGSVDSLHFMRSLRKLNFTGCIQLYGSQTKLELSLPKCECVIAGTNCDVDDLEDGWVPHFALRTVEHVEPVEEPEKEATGPPPNHLFFCNGDESVASEGYEHPSDAPVADAEPVVIAEPVLNEARKQSRRGSTLFGISVGELGPMAAEQSEGEKVAAAEVSAAEKLKGMLKHIVQIEDEIMVCIHVYCTHCV